LGLTAGPVPPRVDATVKAGLLTLVAHAQTEGGWSLRRATAALGLDHVRVLRWLDRAAHDRLVDATPGPDVPMHALLDWERVAIVKLAEDWAEIDRSHRKLAHRGSRLELVYVSESTVLRVLVAEGVHLPERPARQRRERRPFPEWAELVPGVIWIYDFTHFAGLSGWCALAVLDVVSRKWLSTVVSAEESSTQVEIAFTRALVEDGKEYLLDQELLDELAHGVVPDDDERVPVLLAVSDNGPQMTSKATAVFMAGARIAQHFGRPAPRTTRPGSSRSSATSRASTRTWTRSPTPATWKPSWTACAGSGTAPGCTRASATSPPMMNTKDEEAIRAARRAGLRNAHDTRVATRRQLRQDRP
jgi:putative transposase